MLMANTYLNDYCVLDIETTGLDPEKCEILEVGILKFVGGKHVDSYQKLIKPKSSIPPEITAINGITDDMVVNGNDLRKVLFEVRQFVGNMIIVGHNIKFDLSFLNWHGNNMFKSNKFLDTKEVASKLLSDKIPSFHQASLESYYEISNKQKHRAVGDITALSEILSHIISDFGANTIAEFIRR